MDCFIFDISTDFFAAFFACANTGKRMAASIAMIAMTTRSSIRVNPLLFLFVALIILNPMLSKNTLGIITQE